MSEGLEMVFNTLITITSEELQNGIKINLPYKEGDIIIFTLYNIETCILCKNAKELDSKFDSLKCPHCKKTVKCWSNKK
jgi:hypothetical protein